MKNNRYFLVLFFVFCFFVGCVAGGGNSKGSFELTSTNVISGQTWYVNQPIEFRFNKPVDLGSINLNTISILPSKKSNSEENSSNQVIGDFYIKPHSKGKVVVFQPLCPQSKNGAGGGLIPGSISTPNTYQVQLPTESETAGPVVQALDGTRLNKASSFFFNTPATGTAVIDLVAGPPVVENLEELPQVLDLNLFANPLAPIIIRLNQQIDPESVHSETAIKIVFEHSDPAVGEITIPSITMLTGNCDQSGGGRINFDASGDSSRRKAHKNNSFPESERFWNTRSKFS